MRLDPQALDILAVTGVVLGGLALLLGLSAHLRIRSLRKSYTLLQGDGDEAAFVDVVARKTQEVAGLRQDLVRQSQTLSRIQDDLTDAIRHVAVIRYDALGDLGGRYSFSLALLDDSGDGLVLTSIHGRSETRTYFKGVRAGASDDPLSPEELRAIAYAQGRQEP